jgi:surface protein
MYGMFRSATAFNKDLSSWDVSSVINMRGMFEQATAFNQDLSNWDVSSVTSMKYMFYQATNFNQDLSSWDVSSVTYFGYMFCNINGSWVNTLCDGSNAPWEVIYCDSGPTAPADECANNT